MVKGLFTAAALLMLSACLNFVGASNDPCNSQGVCQPGLACRDGVCLEPAAACEGRCGDLGGVDCGGCQTATQICDRNVCRTPCEGRECGTDFDVSCGSCSASHACSVGQCVEICAGRCGTVDGLDCGDCASTSLCWDTQCVPALDCSSPPPLPEPTREDTEPSVSLGMEPSAFAPLCGGWAVFGTPSNQMEVRNIMVEGQAAKSWQFAQTLADIRVDIATGIAYGLLEPVAELVRLDLSSGAMTRLALPAGPRGSSRLFLRPDNRLIVLSQAGEGRVTVVDTQSMTVLDDGAFPITVRAATPISLTDFVASSSVATYRYALAGGAVQELSRSGQAPIILAVSPEQNRLVTVSYGRPIQVYLLPDIETVTGAFTTQRSMSGLGFAPNGRTVVGLSSGGNGLTVWDVATNGNIFDSKKTCSCRFNTCEIQFGPSARTAYVMTESSVCMVALPL